METVKAFNAQSTFETDYHVMRLDLHGYLIYMSTCRSWLQLKLSRTIVDALKPRSLLFKVTTVRPSVRIVYIVTYNANARMLYIFYSCRRRVRSAHSKETSESLSPELEFCASWLLKTMQVRTYLVILQYGGRSSLLCSHPRSISP